VFRLSKHYTTKTTTMYISLHIQTNIFRPNTEINGDNRL